MNKLIFIALLVSLPVFAQERAETASSFETIEPPAITSENPDKKVKGRFNPREHHWLWMFGLEGMKYEVPYEFDGAERNFSPSKQELWGGRLGMGREFYLGKGFLTTTRVEGYYVGTLYPKVNGDDSNFYKKTGQLWGGDLVLSLSYLHHMATKNPVMEEWATLTLEPFIEAGIGRGYAYNRLNYHFDSGPSGVQEDYRQTVEDTLTITRLGAGVNFTGGEGFFFFTKAYVNYFDVIKRTTDTYTKPNQGTATSVHESDSSVSLDPAITIAIGGGYKY